MKKETFTKTQLLAMLWPTGLSLGCCIIALLYWIIGQEVLSVLFLIATILLVQTIFIVEKSNLWK